MFRDTLSRQASPGFLIEISLLLRLFCYQWIIGLSCYPIIWYIYNYSIHVLKLLCDGTVCSESSEDKERINKTKAKFDCW